MELGMIGWRRMLRGNHRVDSAKSWPLYTRDTAGAGEHPSLVKEGNAATPPFQGEEFKK